MPEITAFYTGDVMLLRWGESSSQGRTVTFQLDGDGTAHPFRGAGVRSSSTHGQMFKMVLVAIDENGEPISLRATTEREQQGPVAQLDEQRSSSATDAGSSPAGPAKRTYTRSQVAALKLQDPEFCGWLERSNQQDAALVSNTAEDFHDALLKEVLCIQSKKELDTDPYKAAEWDKLLVTYDLRNTAR